MQTTETTPEPPKSDDKYLSVKQAMARFDVCRSTLWRWSKDFGLPIAYVRGRAYYRISDIQSLIERHFLDKGRAQ
jgi:predicted DNA-binding transcriptional regulator AlpA